MCVLVSVQIIEKYTTQMAAMRAEIERMQPNLKSVEQFASAQVRVLVTPLVQLHALDC
jgi:hypothetical protein